MGFQGMDRAGHLAKPSVEASPTHSQSSEEFPPWSVPPPMMSGSNDIRIPYPHFALIALDAYGNIRCHSSHPTERYLKFLFTPEFQDKFAQTTGRRGSSHAHIFTGDYSTAHKHRYSKPDIDLFSPYGSRKRRREECSHAGASDNSQDLPCEVEDLIRIEIGDEEKIVTYYRNAFMALQQLSCRQIAKAYIKMIEPRKQVKHPYNGGRGAPGEKGDPEKTKPSWWPAGVIHREPDHLRKPDRVELLIHIFRSLGKSHGITAEKLEEAAQETQRKIEPPERREVLDEIYMVRKAEESFERGEIDANTVIYVKNREPPKKTNECEESASDVGRGESPSEADREPATTSSPAPAPPKLATVDPMEPAQKYMRMCEHQPPDQQPQQHEVVAFPSDVRALFLDAKPGTQPEIEFIPESALVSPVEQQSMIGHWSSAAVFQQQQPLFLPIDYGATTAIVPVSGEPVTTAVPLPDHPRNRTTQQHFEFMSPPMTAHPPFRTGSLSHPHLSPQASLQLQSMPGYKSM